MRVLTNQSTGRFVFHLALLTLVREPGDQDMLIIGEKELSGLQGKLACLQVTDLNFGLKIYRELLLYNI